MPWSKGAHCCPHWTYYPVIFCWGVAQNTHSFVNGFCASLLIHIDARGDRSPPPSMYIDGTDLTWVYQIATATLIRRPYLLPSVVYIVDIAYAPAMCHYQMLVPDGMMAWFKKVYQYTSFRERSYYCHEHHQLCYVVHYMSPIPQLSMDAILVLVLLQLVAGVARKTTQSAASFPVWIWTVCPHPAQTLINECLWRMAMTNAVLLE